MDKTKISRSISIGVRIAAIILLIFFFIPSICVSCGDYETKLSAFEAATGSINTESTDNSMSESTNPPAAPWLFIMPVLAIAIGIISTKFHIVTAICSIANIVMMFIFYANVNMYIEDSLKVFSGYVKVQASGTFTFVIVVSALIVVAVIADRILFHQSRTNCASHNNIENDITTQDVSDANIIDETLYKSSDSSNSQ